MVTLDRPRDHDPHTTADFFELLCIFSSDHEVSGEAGRDYIADNTRDTPHNFQLSDNQIVDTYRQFSWRKAAFGDGYPFRLNEAGSVLRCDDVFSDQQQQYLCLLICSSLPFLSRPLHQGITDYFELISQVALRETWPGVGKVMTVGKNNAELHGSKAQRLNTLGKLLGGRPSVVDDDFRPNDQGDAGIDIAAYVPFDNFENENIFAALGQCACSRSGWVAKHGEITFTRLSGLIPCSVPWAEVLFTPISFRESSGRWAVRADIPGVALFDRLRIYNAWLRSGDLLLNMRPQTFADVFSYRMDIV